MNKKKIKIILCFTVTIIAVFCVIYAVQDTYKPKIVDFNYQEDHAIVRDMFVQDWDWLIPISPDQYSLDLVLKHRAPHQNPLYAGRLIFKVMKKKKSIIGFVGYYMVDSQLGRLNFLDVHSDFRNKGYGKSLIQYAINDMVQRGAKRITLVTYPFNEQALTLYKRFGFREIRRDRQVELEYYPN